MIEEFVDFRWEAVLSDKEVQKILNNPSRYKVTAESFMAFLHHAFLVCAPADEEGLVSYKDLAIKIKKEFEIYELIARFKKEYGHIPSHLNQQGLKNFEMPDVEKGKGGFTEEKILSAADRQKGSIYPRYLGDCARLLTRQANEILGGPRHNIVAIVLTAVFCHHRINVTVGQVKDFDRNWRKAR